MTTASIAIVGVGPRGISLLERIAARRNDSSPAVDVHLIDDVELGAGRVWDTKQTRVLCMNTLAARVTLFTEPGATVSAPVLEGPTMYEWIQLMRGDDPAQAGINDAKVELYRTHPADQHVAEEYAAELRETLPHSNPSRALYGEYLRWVYETVLARLPESVTAHRHYGRVINLTEGADADTLTVRGKDSEETISADATVWAAGWVQPGPTEEEAILAEAAHSPQRTWIHSGNPIDQNYSDIPAGETVIARGLGMGFYDIMALTTIGRGGRFVEDDSARSGLRYEAAGEEPTFVITSRRGFPFFPKADFGGLPPEAKTVRMDRAIAKLAGHSDIDFETELWPAIARDAYEAYFTALAGTEPDKLTASLPDIIEVIDNTAPNDLGKETARLTSAPFELNDFFHPLSDVPGDSSREDITEEIARRMQWHIQQARLGVKSAAYAALWVISECRKPISVLGFPGRYTRESRIGRYSEVTALGQMAGSGPPLFRFQQLLALVDAGLASFLGDKPEVQVTDNGFRAVSGKRSVTAATLVDAWTYKPNIRRPGDPLTKQLLADGRLRPFADHGVDTGSPETDDATRLTVHPDGSLDKRLHLVGIPTYAQWPDTTISPMPGTDPLMLQETDKTAASLLKVADA